MEFPLWPIFFLHSTPISVQYWKVQKLGNVSWTQKFFDHQLRKGHLSRIFLHVFQTTKGFEVQIKKNWVSWSLDGPPYIKEKRKNRLHQRSNKVEKKRRTWYRSYPVNFYIVSMVWPKYGWWWPEGLVSNLILTSFPFD